MYDSKKVAVAMIVKLFDRKRELQRKKERTPLEKRELMKLRCAYRIARK